MPPKAQAKKAEVFLLFNHIIILYKFWTKPSKPDESGIPKNDIGFKFELEILQNNIQNYLIIFEWFGVNSESFDKNETPLIETWQPKSSDGIIERKNHYLIWF